MLYVCECWCVCVCVGGRDTTEREIDEGEA